MADLPISSLTLRDKLIHAEKLSRELVDHLDRGLIPKVHGLRRMVRQKGASDVHDDVKDATVRNTVQQLLQADEYSRSLVERSERLLSAIEQEVSSLLENG